MIRDRMEDPLPALFEFSLEYGYRENDLFPVHRRKAATPAHQGDHIGTARRPAVQAVEDQLEADLLLGHRHVEHAELLPIDAGAILDRIAAVAHVLLAHPVQREGFLD